MALYAGYDDNIILHDADGLMVHRCQDLTGFMTDVTAAAKSGQNIGR